MIKLLFISLSMLSAIVLYSQSRNLVEESRLRLVSQLVFVYVDKPHLPDSDPTASYVLNNFEIGANRNLTGNFWTNTDNRNFQNLVKLLLQPARNRQARKFQYQASAILKVHDKRVIVYLINDIDSNHINTSWASKEYITIVESSSSTSAWVELYGLHEIRGEEVGCIILGASSLTELEHDFNREAVPVVLNNLLRTQNNSKLSFDSLRYSYGASPLPRINAIFPDFNAAYQEGLALAFQEFYHQFTDYLETMRNENNGWGYYAIPHSVCNMLPENCCIDLYLSSNNVVPDTSYIWPHRNIPGIADSSIIYFHYKIETLPANIQVHNTLVLSNLFMTYARCFSINVLSNNLHDIRQQTDNAYGFPYLFEEMVKTGNRRSSLESASNAKYLPIALLDYYTGFKLESEEILNLCLRTRSTNDWTIDVSDYWTDRFRGRILQLWENNSNQFNQQLLNRIARLCDVRLAGS